jgi:hypothetical protein
MSLRDWLNNSWLVDHKTSPEEIANLLAIVDRDLSDCRTKGLSPDWRLNIAYNAALQAATVALAAEGYRATRDAHHYRVIQSLDLTIDADEELVTALDGFRKKRNVGDYERAGTISDKEADEMEKLAVQVSKMVRAWLKEHHSNLI